MKYHRAENPHLKWYRMNKSKQLIQKVFSNKKTNFSKTNVSSLHSKFKIINIILIRYLLQVNFVMHIFKYIVDNNQIIYL